MGSSPALIGSNRRVPAYLPQEGHTKHGSAVSTSPSPGGHPSKLRVDPLGAGRFAGTVEAKKTMWCDWWQCLSQRLHQIGSSNYQVNDHKVLCSSFSTRHILPCLPSISSPWCQVGSIFQTRKCVSYWNLVGSNLQTKIDFLAKPPELQCPTWFRELEFNLCSWAVWQISKWVWVETITPRNG